MKSPRLLLALTLMVSGLALSTMANANEINCACSGYSATRYSTSDCQVCCSYCLTSGGKSVKGSHTCVASKAPGGGSNVPKKREN
jgi:hypothetical protein